MIVKNIYVDKLTTSIDSVVRSLIANNISYTLIKNENYLELHFDNYIFNIYFNKVIVNNTDDNLLISAAFKTIEKEMKFEHPKFVDSSKQKKERLGFKKYTKKQMKHDRNKYSPKYLNCNKKVYKV